MSTDKAAAPINLYGATKLCSDKLFSAANNVKGKRNISFSLVRYGNVLGSRGSILSTFVEQSKRGYINITDERMTRFNISMKEAVQMVDWVLRKSIGGEIFVPKLKSFRVIDFAKTLCSKCKIKKSELGQGEKIHEEMITSSDSFNTFDLGKYYAIVGGYKEKTYKFYSKYKKLIQAISKQPKQ